MYVVYVWNAVVPPIVSPTTRNTSRGYFMRARTLLVLRVTRLAATKSSVSCRLRRMKSATIASRAPITNGMRQPHARSCSVVRNTCCRSSRTRMAHS